MKIVIDNKIPFIKDAFKDIAETVFLPGNKISGSDVRDADALIVRTRTKCNKSLLEGSKVKFIATATIGFDHIDTAYCKENEIKWTNAPGCNSSSVEQYLVSALLYLAAYYDFNLKASTLGVIGVGHVGSKVARAANVLGLNVLLNDPPRERVEGSGEFVSLEELLKKSDIVSLHVPLIREGGDKTLAMASRDFFMQMKEDAAFINTSRGEVVDEDALKEAIKSERISAAVLDVFAKEPHLDMDLLSRLSIATPHIAGYSTDGKVNGTEMSVRAVSKFFNMGMDNWKVKKVPEPPNKMIYLEAGEGEELDIISEAYAMTYSLQEDHDRLVDAAHSFEKFRGEYRLRREASAYSIRLFNDDGKYRKILEGLGFNVLADSCM